jgi:hypothetical protein
MFNHDTQLLCTFSNSSSYESDMEKLLAFYTVDYNCVYVLQNVDSPTEIFLTYNASKLTEGYFPKTISVHRKRDYNVLYSINALNELVKLENNGNFSSVFDIPWSKYRNSLIITKDGKLKITPTRLVKISHL